MAAIRWTSHLGTTEDRRGFEQRLIESRDIIQRLAQIIRDDLRSSQNSTLREEGYDRPTWAFHQADQIGFQRALTKVLELIGDIDG